MMTTAQCNGGYGPGQDMEVKRIEIMKTKNTDIDYSDNSDNADSEMVTRAHLDIASRIENTDIDVGCHLQQLWVSSAHWVPSPWAPAHIRAAWRPARMFARHLQVQTDVPKTNVSDIPALENTTGTK